MYCCLHLFIYQVYFLIGDMYICTGSLLYVHICVTTTVCMYTCMVITYSKGKDQSGKVANPARGQVKRTGKINSSLSPFAPENLISRDVFGSPVPRQPAHLNTQTESSAYLRDSSRVPRQRPFIIGTHYVL